jgi:hypothetical protein
MRVRTSRTETPTAFADRQGEPRPLIPTLSPEGRGSISFASANFPAICFRRPRAGQLCALALRLCFPYDAAGGWWISPQGGRQDAGQFFVGTGVPSKNPAARTRTRRARHRGALLFGYFLLGKQEKVTRAPTASESFCSEPQGELQPLTPALSPEGRGSGVSGGPEPHAKPSPARPHEPAMGHLANHTSPTRAGGSFAHGHGRAARPHAMCMRRTIDRPD